jgi:hypothetical protein
LPFILLVCGCGTPSSSPVKPDAAIGQTGKPAPTTAGEAPPLESFDSSAPNTVPIGNTPVPCGVRCLPLTDTDADIVYGCTVYVSRLETAFSAGYTCSPIDPILMTASPDLALMPAAAPDANTDFALSLPKASFPTLKWLGLTVHCYVSGGGTEVNRPYLLEPRKPL